MELNKIYHQNCLIGLPELPDNCIDCCITSPPYFGLRDYGYTEQIGLEETPELYVQKLVEVFTEVKRVLKKEGTLWLNLGDSYVANGQGQSHSNSFGKERTNLTGESGGVINQPNARARLYGYKPKDLIGIPWLVAFALRNSGWYLRQDIIWHKPNPMPESVTDRCTKAHEYIFLMSKSSKYYYDAEAIKTEVNDPIIYKTPDGWDTGKGGHGSFHKSGREKGFKGYEHRGPGDKKLTGHSGNFDSNGNLIGGGFANKRSVWTVNTMPYREAHFATFPEKLIVDMIKAGCPVDGIVLDPFMGAGTVALVARKLNRNFIGYELKKEYVSIADARLKNELGMFL